MRSLSRIEPIAPATSLLVRSVHGFTSRTNGEDGEAAGAGAEDPDGSVTAAPPARLAKRAETASTAASSPGNSVGEPSGTFWQARTEKRITTANRPAAT